MGDPSVIAIVTGYIQVGFPNSPLRFVYIGSRPAIEPGVDQIGLY